MEKRTRKRLIWAGGAAVLILLLALAFRPTPLPVETASVSRGPMEVTIDADGVTRVVDRFVIGAPVTGRLQRIDVNEGDRVEEGAVLARITPMPLDPQAISQARAALSAAEARVQEANQRVIQASSSMELARRTAERIGAVVREGGMSQEALDRAELEATNSEREYAAAQARLRAAESEVSAARAALLDVDPERSAGRAAVSVTSPSAGRVLRVYERSERVVPAGTLLLDVGDATGLEVVVDVLSTDAVRIPPGAPIRIEEWGGGRALPARVRQVEPAAFTRVSSLGVEEQRVNVIGDLLESPSTLGDGYQVEARIVVWESPDALRVPVSALFGEEGDWQVFVVEARRARIRNVDVGHRGTDYAEILSGLADGEEVILYPGDEIADGARVVQTGG